MLLGRKGREEWARLKILEDSGCIVLNKLLFSRPLYLRDDVLLVFLCNSCVYRDLELIQTMNECDCKLALQ